MRTFALCLVYMLLVVAGAIIGNALKQASDIKSELALCKTLLDGHRITDTSDRLSERRSNPLGKRSPACECGDKCFCESECNCNLAE